MYGGKKATHIFLPPCQQCNGFELPQKLIPSHITLYSNKYKKDYLNNFAKTTSFS